MKSTLKIIIVPFFIFFTGLLQTSNAQIIVTPADYHNYIIAEQVTVVNAIIGFTNQLNSKDSVLLDNYYKTKAILKKSLDKIRKLPPYKGDSEYIDAALPLFEFYYSTMDIEYKEIVDLFIKKDFGVKIQQRVNYLLKSINERENILDARMNEAQVKFAQKYHLELKNNDLQKEVDKLHK